MVWIVRFKKQHWGKDLTLWLLHLEDLWIICITLLHSVYKLWRLLSWMKLTGTQERWVSQSVWQTDILRDWWLIDLLFCWLMDWWTVRLPDFITEWQTESWLRTNYQQTDSETDRYTDRQVDRRKDRQKDIQTEAMIDRCTEGLRNRQIFLLRCSITVSLMNQQGHMLSCHLSCSYIEMVRCSCVFP